MNEPGCVCMCVRMRVCECPFSLSPGKEKGLEERLGRWPGRRGQPALCKVLAGKGMTLLCGGLTDAPREIRK